jgi:hypothetical protein
LYRFQSQKKPTCEPIFWKDEINEQVGIKASINEEVEDELREMSTCTQEMSIMYVDNHSCICTLVAHVGAINVPPKKEAAKNVNHYFKQNT